MMKMDKIILSEYMLHYEGAISPVFLCVVLSELNYGYLDISV